MSGTVESVKVKVGDKVSKGDLLITLISESKNEIEKKEESLASLLYLWKLNKSKL